ncbi:MAG: tyrosine-type recombinase/integrase [Acidiferrobacterales bacterium]
MGRKRPPGLYKRNGIWHIDKQIRGRRLCESTGERNLAKAEHYLARKTEEARQALLYGVRPKRSFRQAATKYLKENCQKRSIGDDAMHLRQLDPYIGSLSLEAVHMGALRAFIAARQAQGMKSKTINAALAVVRHMLNLAASEWVDEHNLAWLESSPKIKLLAVTDARAPYPLSWGEQARLFRELPPHLARMALFKVNTGCREQELCRLRWRWEVPVPELATSVFLIPSECVKNGEERLIVLNAVARSVIEAVRGMHSEFVFVHRGKPVARMNNTAWQHARVRVGLAQVRVHDLKHTFGRRLRSAGVSFEDRQDLLGHKSGRITTHYSGPELGNLIAAANKVCTEGSRKSPALVLLRRGNGA